MLESIKKFMNWPTTGVKNIGEFGSYCKANWISLLFLVIGVLIVIWLLKKAFGFISEMFKG